MTLSSLIRTFKDSVAQANLLMELTPEYVVICLAMSLLCALLVLAVYCFFYRGPCFSGNFAVLLVMTALITTTIIMTISANLVLSLGMVGALSIVRFRAAIKDPLDVGFLFWSVAVGITCGAGLYLFSLTGTLFIAVVYCVLQLARGRVQTYLVVVRCASHAREEVDALLRQERAKLRSATCYPQTYEVTASFRMNEKRRDMSARLLAIEGVESALTVEYTGDVG